MASAPIMSNPAADIQPFGNWLVPSSENEQVNPVMANEQSQATGQRLYLEYCSACHGNNADGKSLSAGMLYPPPANLRAISGIYPDGNLAYKIRSGRNQMPAWGADLSETEIWHLVNFIQSLASR